MNFQKVFVATFILVSATLFVGCGSMKFTGAIMDGDISTVQNMLDQGEADVNKDMGFGKTPIFYALEKNKDEMVRFLLEKGAKVDVRDDEGRCPLTMAAKMGKDDLVKDMVEAGGNPDSKGESGMTALMIYTQQRNGLSMAKYLVENGADVNATNDRSWGKRPLNMSLSKSGNLEVANYLFEQGAKVDAGSLSSALHRDRDLAMKMLETMDRIPSSVLTAVIDDDELFNEFMERGADPSGVVKTCAMSGDIKCLRKLAEAGADPNKSVRNPLEFAKNAETAKVLVEMGADVNKGVPVHKAVWDEDAERIRFLVNEAGADINKKDDGSRPIGGQTPMHVAAYRDKYDMLKVLLECKGPHKFNLKNEEGKTVLDYVTDSQLRVMLLDKGAKSSSSL